MAYIHKIKEKEIIGGTEDIDLYPVTSTQAVYSQNKNGAVPTGVEPKLEDRLSKQEEGIQYLDAAVVENTQEITNIRQNTYTKEQVDNLINTSKGVIFVLVDELPQASAATLNKIYLVPNPDSEDIKDEYITVLKTVNNITVYDWEYIGSTALDLTGYPTTDEMLEAIEEALTKYYTKQEVNDKVAYNTLKTEPLAYIKNVHYDITNNTTSVIDDYVNDSIRSERLDQPLPVVIYADAPVSIYPQKFHTSGFHFSAVDGKVTAYNLIPGKQYFYKVSGEEEWKAFSIENTRRFIYAGNIKNIRDLGGILTEDGGKVAYDSIFRGSEMTGNTVHGTSADLQIMNRLGITLDLDLRDQDEAVNPSGRSPINANYKRMDFIRFEDVASLDDEKKAKVKKAFETVAEEVIRGGKVYIHCVWGYHRAGFLSTLIEGVLGVKQCEIDKDYELSSFSPLGEVTRKDTNYKTGITALNDLYGGSWTNLALSCGISSELIEKFRNVMVTDVNKQNVVKSQYYEVSYEELVNLRDNGLLIPCAQYRIIDFDTESSYDAHVASCSGIHDLPENKSAYHHFDLIVTALTPNTLDETARAAHSERDVEGYYKDKDLSKWELKYCLDNDKDKYSWATNDYIKTGEERIDVPFGTSLESYDGDYYYVFNGGNPLVFTVIAYGNRIMKKVVGGEFLDNANVAIGDTLIFPEEYASSVVEVYKSVGESAVRAFICNKSDIEKYYMKSIYTIVQGKGVIYYLKDDKGNELPYDFYNILYKVGNLWTPTFAYRGYTEYKDAENVYCNIIKARVEEGIQHLNKNLFITNREYELIKDNFIDSNTYDNTFKGSTINCTVGKFCTNLDLSNIDTCKIGDDCVNIKSLNASNLIVGAQCYALQIPKTPAAFVEIEARIHDKTFTHFTTSTHVYNSSTSELVDANVISTEEFNAIFG